MYRVNRFGEPTDWNEAAADAAERIAAHLPRLERGVLPWWNHEFSIVFGNDGYNSGPGRRPRIDRRAKLEIHLLRQQLPDARAREMGFGLSPDNYTWAMIVTSHDRSRLEATLADASLAAQNTGRDNPVWTTLEKSLADPRKDDDEDDEHPEVAD
jgi:hypothetical protein